MSDQINFHGKTMDQIVFDGRNQAYGAFILRQSSARNQLLAFAFCTGVFLIALKVPSFLPHQLATVITQVDSIILDQDIEEIKPKVEQKQDAGPRSTQKTTDPDMEKVAVEKNQLDTGHFEKPKPDGTLTGISNPNGSDSGVFNNKSGNGTGGGGSDKPGDIYKDEKPVMPEFRGGEAALALFLDDNKDAEAIGEEEGIVTVKFSVDETGRIYNVSIGRSSGSRTLDEEAMRLVRIQPRYKPGTHHGKPIKMACEMSIEFTTPR